MRINLTLTLITALLCGMTTVVMAEKRLIREIPVLPFPDLNTPIDSSYAAPTSPPPPKPVKVDGTEQEGTPTVTATANTATNTAIDNTILVAAPPPPQSPFLAAAPPPPPPPVQSATPVQNPIQAQSPTAPAQSTAQWDEIGEASWYGGRFQGRQTANGEVFDTNLLTAAHQTLPFNTIVRVYNPKNDKSVLVRINDRGPFIDDRIIDLSRAAATQIDTAQIGVSEVYLQIVRLGEEKKEVTIQMGAFSQYGNAVDLITDLKRDGFIPQIENVNDMLFRVILANVSRERIDTLRQQLSDKGYHNILVRTR